MSRRSTSFGPRLDWGEPPIWTATRVTAKDFSMVHACAHDCWQWKQPSHVLKQNLWRAGLVCFFALLVAIGQVASADDPSFTRDIKPLLSNRCFRCHGPDAAERQGDLRLDTADGATADRDGHSAIKSGAPDESELIKRITSTDPDFVMPPPEGGERLSVAHVDLLRRWIQAGAQYQPHWSYVIPTKPPVPSLTHSTWPRNEIDFFVAKRLEEKGLAPQEEAPRAVLARRLSLDLIGLPISPEDVDLFVADASTQAVENLVDRLLVNDGYGEHQARQWLDMARYADSAGYADDGPRKIWGWRDWVIRAFDSNMPFNEFTIKQLAGDLLPSATIDDRIATAFHRNTLTNSEGGTIDEEFRSVAVVDRVNTTMSTWMGTTMACCQCHDHKYDSLSQKDYFGIYAILNNTADADFADERPLLEFHTLQQISMRESLLKELAVSELILATKTPDIQASHDKWDRDFPRDLGWKISLAPTASNTSGTQGSVDSEGTVLFSEAAKQETTTLTIPLQPGLLSAIQLQFPGDKKLPMGGSGHAAEGNFVISGVRAQIAPKIAAAPRGRFLRIELPGKSQFLSLAEVEVFEAAENVAHGKIATQKSTGFEGVAARAVDGITDGDYYAKNSVTHTLQETDPWWEVDLGTDRGVDRVVVWNRTDGGTGSRLVSARVILLDSSRMPIWDTTLSSPPAPSVSLSPTGIRDLPLSVAFADRSQAGFDASGVLRNFPLDEAGKKTFAEGGWAPGSAAPSHLTLVLSSTVEVPADTSLLLTLHQHSKQERHTVGAVRISLTADPRVIQWNGLPADVVSILLKPAEKRVESEQIRINDYYRRTLAPQTTDARNLAAKLSTAIADIKPSTVPVFEELPEGTRRVTKLQYRGNYLDLGPEVTEGLPSILNSGATVSDSKLNRLALAKWLVAPTNPLTSRVVVNRIWEKLFGIGLVSTSEEFGSQGELPSHPELLDWLAVELMQRNWDTKAIIRLIVTSATYRQSSRAPAELIALDPENRLLACGPRVRLSAEVIRDQALAASGLLSRKKGGPSVNPPQPNVGLSAAFGSGIDWKTSEGEDRYRRAIYTTWRRSNPYPSMATFDAPNREVCTLRRPRTNTPLQALVTLNDPVFVEVSQALARRMVREGGSVSADRALRGFRLMVARHPSTAEIDRLVALHDQALADFRENLDAARLMATEPIGPIPPDLSSDIADLAAWTVVANVLVNLDESFMCP